MVDGKGVKRAADEVYTLFAPAVLGYFRGHGVRDADDLTGDVFVKVTENLSRFRGNDAALRRWVFTIAHHRMVDEFRRAGRSSCTVEFDENRRAVSEIDPLDAVLVRAISELTAEQREVIVLRFVADLSLDDVAKITGRRTGAVKMAQARGLTALQTALSASRVP